MGIDKAEVLGTVIGKGSNTKIFQFDLSVDKTVTGQASGSATVAATTKKTWTDFELSNPKILYMKGDVTFTVTLKGPSGHYDNGAAGREIQVDGLTIMELPLSTAPLSEIHASNVTSSAGGFTFWMSG